MTEPRESLSSKIVVPVVVAVLVALLAGGTAPWWWDRLFPPSSSTSSGATLAPPTFGPTQAPPTGAPGSPTNDPTGVALDGCVLTITYSFATIRDEPSHQSAEIGDVPEGDYEASNTTLVDWAGQEERWFEITAEGRTGWIVYNGIMIDSKSAACP